MESVEYDEDEELNRLDNDIEEREKTVVDYYDDIDKQ
jgi:hypothetical protein